LVSKFRNNNGRNNNGRNNYRSIKMIDYYLLITLISTTITIAVISIYINHLINKPQVVINRNKRCVTIHKIKSQFRYAIVTENNNEIIVTDQDKIKVLTDEAIYNSD